MWHDLRLLSKYRSGSQQRYRPRFTESFNIAAGIVRRMATGNYADTDTNICNSSQTLKELKSNMRRYGLYDASKRHVVIPLGVSEAYLRTRIWQGERNDFVYLGTIHLKHKNLGGLLRVFDRIAEARKSRLHIFTSSPGAQQMLASLMQGLKHVSERNVMLHYRADDHIVAEYMSRAAAYLHLSKYEAQGLTVLEAIAYGTNALTLRDATIPEETRRYAFKGTEDEIAAKAIELASDPKPASKQAIKYARGFTWERMVRRTLAEYRRLL
jgi:glycosyltransferase involved in cell wall biosynthesis